jgi:hypothetical protein
MKKRLSLLICGILLISPVFFMACSNDPEDNSPPTYSVTGETYLTEAETISDLGGTITASPSGGPAGTQVTVSVTSKAGYVLEEVFVDGVSKGKANPVPVTLVDKNVTVKAYFKAIPTDSNGKPLPKVILLQPVGGVISFKIDGTDEEFAQAGTNVTLSNTPSTGYAFKEYTATYADGNIDITANTFALPATDVTVSGSFEELAGKSIDELIMDGKTALKAGNLAAAIDAYDAAYSKDPDNTEALVYSALGKLVSVATSGQVGNFFKNSLGLKYYPSNLDVLLDPGSWFDYYPQSEWEYSYYDSALGEYLYWESKDYWYDEEWFNKTYTKGDGYYYRGPYKFVSAERKYYDNDPSSSPISSYEDDSGDWIYWYNRDNYSYNYSYFDKYYPNGTGYYYGNSTYVFVTNVPHYEYVSQPPLNVPEWIKDKGPYKDSFVTIGGKDVASSSTWPIILIANLIDKNPAGLNPALDDIIAAIFDNPSYKEAETRTGKLKDKDPVLLDAEIIESFGLSQALGEETIYVGWAELELLLSALKLVKGTLLYVDSYNWEYNGGFVKDLPWDESILEEGVLENIISSHRSKVLPLRTGFMTARSGSYMEDSRKAYAEALASILGVYDYYIGDKSSLPTGIKAELKKFEEYKTLVSDAKDAINSKGSFTVPADLLDGETLSVDFGKLFNPGQLALENLIETEGSGSAKSPVFYSSARDSDGKLSNPKKINTAQDIESLNGEQGIGLKIKTAQITDIVGIDDDLAKYLLQGLGVEFAGNDAYIIFDPMVGTIAWAVYHWDEGGEDIFGSGFDEFAPKPARRLARLR